MVPAVGEGGGGRTTDEADGGAAEKYPRRAKYAGGGAACGISGSEVWGYLSGNGLLTAVNLGRLAGRTAAKQIEAEGKKYAD